MQQRRQIIAHPITKQRNEILQIHFKTQKQNKEMKFYKHILKPKNKTKK